MSSFLFESVKHNDVIANCGCFLCGKDHTDKYAPLVDLNKTILGEGRLVLCASCIYTLASLLGFAHPEDVSAAKNEASRFKAESLDLKNRLDTALAALELRTKVKISEKPVQKPQKSKSNGNRVAPAGIK